MTRAALAALVAALVLIVGAPAHAQEADCGAFSRTQTYVGWGPALHYGETVTVSFWADACTVDVADGTFTYALEGAAAVYAGGSAEGEPLASVPFVSSGSFADADGSGWPPSWWSCDVDAAEIAWELPGVYSFVASASPSGWTLDVAVPGHEPVHWTRGC